MFKNFKYRDARGVIYMTYLLILINTGIYILQNILPITKLFALYPIASESHWIFQYFTACFLHGGVMHLVMNMLVLVFFGVFIEQKFGRFKFLSLYLVSGVLANVLYHLFSTPILPALGASGAIFGVMAALTIFVPNMKVYLFGLLPLKLWIAIGLMLSYEIYKILVPSDSDMVGHIVHVSGALVGSLYYLFFLRKHR